MQSRLFYKTRINEENGQPLPHENLRKVFVSYKKTDNKKHPIRDMIVDEILKEINVAVWYDTNLTPGEDYDKEIQNAIENCDVVVLLLTENILDSKYVWEQEIEVAKKLEKGIIPISMGISNEKLEIANERLNHRHCLSCSVDREGRVSFSDDFKESLKRALEIYVLDEDLIRKIEQFFKTGKDRISTKYLSYEQMYHMGCGYMNGIGTQKDANLSSEILKSIINGYGKDPEFLDLKSETSSKLFYFYLEGNDYEGIRTWAMYSLKLGNLKIIKELNSLYSDNTYHEMLSDGELRTEFYNAVKQYGLQENYKINTKKSESITTLNVQKTEISELKKGSMWVNGYEFYLAGKKEGDYLRDVCLMRDDMVIDTYFPSHSPGPGNAIFFHFDEEKQVIRVLESDFDHYSIETDYAEYVYYNIFEDTIERHGTYVGTNKYATCLPYNLRAWRKVV